MDDDRTIEIAIEAARLPASVNRDALKRGVRDTIEAARNADAEVRVIRNAIEGLRSYAKKVADGQKKYLPMLAERLGELPERARQLLVDRAELLSRRRQLRIPVQLPTRAEVENPSSMVAAAKRILILTQIGGVLKKGRLRPGGKRSRPTVEPVLYAPAPRQSRPRNEAARNLVMSLALAWTEASGDEPPYSVHPATPGPFARFTRAILDILNMRHVDAVKLVNWYGGQRRILPKASADGHLRWRPSRAPNSVKARGERRCKQSGCE